MEARRRRWTVAAASSTRSFGKKKRMEKKLSWGGEQIGGAEAKRCQWI
jgi:hypothetical protein